jgi:hypothetical protein
MNQDQFAYWLQGFVEMNGGKEPTKAQWKMIKDHLQLCFKKLTPPLMPYGVGGSYGGDIKQIFKDGTCGGGLGSDADKYAQYSFGGAGVPMNKYGRALTNAEIEQRKAKGGGGGC